MPTAASLAYNSVSTVQTPITLETEHRVTQDSTTKDTIIEQWVNLDKDAQPQVETVTITTSVPVADCYFRVAIDGPTAGADRVYLYEFLTASGDTAPTIAARLAELIDQSVDVSAVAVTNTIVITSVLPGTNGAFTATVDCRKKSDDTTISSKIATATTTAASGTGKVRKIAQFALRLASSSSGAPELQVRDGVWYNGAASPVSVQQFGPIPFSGPTTLDALRAVS